jgi:hypothetical protein
MHFIPIDLASDYFVVTREDRTTRTWTWEIERRSKPLGIRLYDSGFSSDSAAKLAGEKSLRRLLEDIVRDQAQ